MVSKHSDLPIFDGHNDVLLTLDGGHGLEARSFFELNEQGHIDLPRARKGNFAGGIFAVFVEPEKKEKANRFRSMPCSVTCRSLVTPSK